jgi:hypothetical protein
MDICKALSQFQQSRRSSKKEKLECSSTKYCKKRRMSREEPEGLNLKQKPKPAQKQNNPKTTTLRSKRKIVAQIQLRDRWDGGNTNPQY